MLSKISMIAIFVAVCIDRSFEEPRVFECDCDEDVLSIVYFQGLHNGYIPIVVTNTKKDEETVNQVKKIKHFFDTKDPGIKMFEVFYKHGGASRGTAVLVYNANNRAMKYPFVGIMKDHRMLSKVVVGFNESELNDLFELARRPILADEHFQCSQFGFSYDLYKKMKKWKRHKTIDQKVIEAAEKPDVPRTTTAFPATQSDSWQPAALDSGTGTSLVSQYNANKRQNVYPPSPPTFGTGQILEFQSNTDTQRDIYPPKFGSSTSWGSQPNPNTPQSNYQSNPPTIGSSTSLTFEPDPNTPQYNSPPTYDKSTSWTFDHEPDPESYIYNYPTTPTFDINSNWVLPPIEYPQHLFDPPGPPATGSSTSSSLPPTGNQGKRKSHD